MADKDFVVKNGIVVNSSFTANSTQLALGSNLVINTSTIAVGSNVIVNTGTFFIGNDSVNTSISSGSIYINGQLAVTSSNLTSISTVLTANNTDGNTFYIPVSNNISGTWTNAVIASSRMTFIPLTGSLTINAISAQSQISTANVLVGSNVYVNTSTLWFGNSTVNTIVNSSQFTGTANNSNYLSGNSITDVRTYADTKAATAYSNAIAYSGNAALAYANAIAYSGNAALAYANAASYTDTKAATAYTNAIAYSGSAATAYSNAVYYAGNAAANAYSNATSYADTKAGNAYTNATSYADTKAGNAYTNATTYASNAGNITTGTLPWPQAPSGTVNTSGSFTFTGVETFNGNVVFGNSTIYANITSNTSTTYFTGISYTANNSSYVGGNSASDLRTYTDNKAATAYTNAIAYSGNAAQAYTNAVSYVVGQSYVTATNLTNNLSNYALLSTPTFTTSVNVGSNVQVNTSALFLGNGTVNAYLIVNSTTAGLYVNGAAYTSGSGGGYYKGSSGTIGSAGNQGLNIFRINANTLSNNVTLASGENAQATGPLQIVTGYTLTIQSDARAIII